MSERSSQVSGSKLQDAPPTLSGSRELPNGDSAQGRTVSGNEDPSHNEPASPLRKYVGTVAPLGLRLTPANVPNRSTR